MLTATQAMCDREQQLLSDDSDLNASPFNLIHAYPSNQCLSDSTWLMAMINVRPISVWIITRQETTAK